MANPHQRLGEGFRPSPGRHRVTFSFFLLGTLAATGLAQAGSIGRVRGCLIDPSCQRMIVAAHRQGYKDTFENSSWAIRRHLDGDTDMLEMDVRETRDRELVLMHDSSVDRTTTGTGKVRRLRLAEIKRLKIKGLDEPPPTLEEVADLVRGRIFVFLDVKEASLDKVWEVVKRRGIADQAIIFVDRRQEYDEINDLLASGERIQFMPRLREGESVANLMDSFRSAPPFLHIDETTLRPEILREIRARHAHAYMHFPAAGSAAGLRAAGLSLLRQGVHFFDHDEVHKVYEALADAR